MSGEHSVSIIQFSQKIILESWIGWHKVSILCINVNEVTWTRIREGPRVLPQFSNCNLQGCDATASSSGEGWSERSVSPGGQEWGIISKQYIQIEIHICSALFVVCCALFARKKGTPCNISRLLQPQKKIFSLHVHHTLLLLTSSCGEKQRQTKSFNSWSRRAPPMKKQNQSLFLGKKHAQVAVLICAPCLHAMLRRFLGGIHLFFEWFGRVDAMLEGNSH